LINMRGEVVGINSQIYSRSGGFQGISFAIPIDEAVRVSDQIRTSGRVTRGRIGVQIDQVSKEVAESIGLGQPKGALVRGVEPNSPAAKAGVEPGDIILKFDGKEIDKSVDLPRLVGNTKPGNKSSMTVFRRGSQRELSVTVAELEPEQPQVRAAAPEAPKPQAAGAAKALGLTLADLNAAQKKELGLKGGVRVVATEGPAARAGLREGDVIVAIANADTSDVKELEAALTKLDKSRPVNVLFRRGEWAQYAVIRPGR
jgi:serine protease Do